MAQIVGWVGFSGSFSLAPAGAFLGIPTESTIFAPSAGRSAVRPGRRELGRLEAFETKIASKGAYTGRVGYTHPTLAVRLRPTPSNPPDLSQGQGQPAPPAPSPPPTHMTPTVPPTPGDRSGARPASAIPAKPPSPRRSSTITRPGSTIRWRGGFCRRTRWAIRMMSIGTSMSATTRSTTLI